MLEKKANYTLTAGPSQEEDMEPSSSPQSQSQYNYLQGQNHRQSQISDQNEESTTMLTNTCSTTTTTTAYNNNNNSNLSKTNKIPISLLPEPISNMLNDGCKKQTRRRSSNTNTSESNSSNNKEEESQNLSDDLIIDDDVLEEDLLEEADIILNLQPQLTTAIPIIPGIVLSDDGDSAFYEDNGHRSDDHDQDFPPWKCSVSSCSSFSNTLIRQVEEKQLLNEKPRCFSNNFEDMTETEEEDQLTMNINGETIQSPTELVLNNSPTLDISPYSDFWCDQEDHPTQFNMDISPTVTASLPLVSMSADGDHDIQLPEGIIMPDNILGQPDKYTDADGENANLLPKENFSKVSLDDDKAFCDGSSLGKKSNDGIKKVDGVTEVDENNFKSILVPPNGGFGWAVLFGSLIVNILIPGMIKSYGVLFIDIVEDFEDATPARAAWIPALSYFLYSSMGFFASGLAVRFSHRTVTIVGGLLSSTGLALSYFATSVTFLYVSYGIISGLGAGLCYPIGVFMVGQYFDSKRGLANGICTSGSALGSVLFPPLLRFLLSTYGYRTAILIMAGIVLNVCVGALFYDPVEKHLKRILVPRSTSENTIVNNEAKPSSGVTEMMMTSSVNISNGPGKGKREVAASLPIAIPFHHHQNSEFRDRDLRERRGSGSVRKATFQIGNDDGWSLKSSDTLGTSPLAVRLMKEDVEGHGSSPRLQFFRNRHIQTIQAPVIISSIESTSDAGDNIVLITPCAAPPVTTVSTNSGSSNNNNNNNNNNNTNNSSNNITVPSGQQQTTIVASGGPSKLNLMTAIPEGDDDNDNDDCIKSVPERENMIPPQNSDVTSRNIEWTSGGAGSYSSTNQSHQHPQQQQQRHLRLSVGGGNQLLNSSQQQMSTSGLPRTLSVASNVSTSSFHYVSTLHHASLLSALQADQNIPNEFASTLTLKSVRKSCCSQTCCFSNCCGYRNCKTNDNDNDDEIDKRENELQDTENNCNSYSRPSKAKLIDFSLFRDGIYIIMLLSNSTTAIGYTNFLIVLPAYALDLGFDKSEASNLLSVVAGFDFIGRIGGAALSDLRFISRKWFYILGLFFSGIALSFLPMATTYKALFIYCACFGLASGTYIGVTAVILADELGLEKLGSSYGITLFVNGIFQLAGPPICGQIFESYRKYQPILTTLGCILILGASFWLAVPFIEHNRKKKLLILQQQQNQQQQPNINGHHHKLLVQEENSQEKEILSVV